MTPPRYVRPPLTFTWPTPAQVHGYYEAIIGTDLFDTLLWDGPDTPDDLHDYWAARRADYAAGPEHDLSLAVVHTASDTMIGACSLRPVLVSHGVWNVGYALAPSWHGRGHGSAVVRLLVEIAFTERGAERIEADVFVGNVASRRVLEKAGFRLEGTARGAVCKGGERRDEWRFGLLRTDLEPGGE